MRMAKLKLEQGDNEMMTPPNEFSLQTHFCALFYDTNTTFKNNITFVTRVMNAFKYLVTHREVLGEGGQIEMKLAQTVVEFEIKIEECVLKPLQVILDHDLPNVYKLKRTLGKLTETMDAAKAKLQQASRNSHTGGAAGKIDNIKDEWEDAQQKVEQCRVNYNSEECYNLR